MVITLDQLKTSLQRVKTYIYDFTRSFDFSDRIKKGTNSSGNVVDGALIEGDISTSVASGQYSHAEGFNTNAYGVYSHTEGYHTSANGYSHAEGYNTEASGNYAHAEGNNTMASWDNSHAEGIGTKARATSAHAEGSGSEASGNYAHAEGGGTKAIANGAHAEGSGTTARGVASHAEGQSTQAQDASAHAEGGGTIAQGLCSHAEGGGTTATGNCSHAEGSGTIARGLSEHVFGEYNIESNPFNSQRRSNYVEIVGNGSINARSNARTLDWSGNEVLAGKLTVGADPTNAMDVATKGYTDTALEDAEAMIAPEFDASSSYVAGDYVLNGGKLYRFTADHATGAFDGTDAVEVTVVDEMNLKANKDDFAMSVGTVTTLPTGSDATASITGEYDAMELNLGIPRGESGVYVGETAPIGNENVWIDTSGDPDTNTQGIADLTNRLNNIENVKYRTVLSDTYTGILGTQVNVDIPAGEYIITVDNVESTDTDATTCSVVFSYTTSGITLLNLKRGSNIKNSIVFENDVNQISIYASDNYANSVGDTFTFTNFNVFKYYPLKQKIDALETNINETRQYIVNETSVKIGTESVPNIQSELPTNWNTGQSLYYLSDRVISKGSVIKTVKISTNVANTGSILFINDENVVVYKKDVSCVTNEWNVFDIDLLASENLRIATNCRASWVGANAPGDSTFCTDGSLWSSSQTNVNVGDTITFTKASSTIYFMFSIQWEVDLYGKLSDSIITVKDKRPESGYHNFSVLVNYSDYTEDANDGESLYTDYGVIALPTNYSATGTPTKLIIACGGSADRIGATTNPLTLQGWEYFLAKGYAVMDMNGISAAWTVARDVPYTNLHYCSKYLLQSYLSGYKYVMKKYNLEERVFVTGISMGGGAAALITQTNIIPVIANALFCPALSVYKQDYLGSWGGDNQRISIAGHWNFPDWKTTTPSQEYFLQNIDKIKGFDNLLIRTIGDHDTANANYGNEAEAAAYNSMQKIYPVPIKIWHCIDDSTVYYRYSLFMVNMIKNGGGQAWLRSFTTGGHIGGWNGGSVSDTDIDGNTVTTSIPFYEAILFFKRFGGDNH